MINYSNYLDNSINTHTNEIISKLSQLGIKINNGVMEWTIYKDVVIYITPAYMFVNKAGINHPNRILLKHVITVDTPQIVRIEHILNEGKLILVKIGTMILKKDLLVAIEESENNIKSAYFVDGPMLVSTTSTI